MHGQSHGCPTNSAQQHRICHLVGLPLRAHGANYLHGFWLQMWSVDINAPFSAQLPFLAFEGVTRRNHPNLKPGDVVYARVVTAN